MPPTVAAPVAYGCSVLDYEMASQLHCALLRVLMPDYDGVDGWDKRAGVLARPPMAAPQLARHPALWPPCSLASWGA